MSCLLGVGSGSDPAGHKHLLLCMWEAGDGEEGGNRGGVLDDNSGQRRAAITAWRQDNEEARGAGEEPGCQGDSWGGLGDGCPGVGGGSNATAVPVIAEIAWLRADHRGGGRGQVETELSHVNSSGG